MYNFAYFFLTLLLLGTATYTDLKQRIVPNKLTYSMLLIGLALKILETITTNTLEPITTSLLGGIIAFTLSYTLWKMGIWAGGDVKLVTTIGLINPINYAIIAGFFGLGQWPFTAIQLPIFSASIIIYSALMVLPLGLFMSIRAGIKNKKAIQNALAKIKEKTTTLILVSVLGAGAKTITETYFSLEPITASLLVLTVIILASLLHKKIRFVLIGAAGILGIYIGGTGFIIDAIAITIPIVIGYSLWKIFAETKGLAFKEEIKLSELEEGMIPEKFLVEKNGKIILEDAPSIKSVIKNIIDNKIRNPAEVLAAKGKVIASPFEAGGITQEEAEYIKTKARGITTIIIKKTMAFVPAILLAYLVLQATGDIIWNVIF